MKASSIVFAASLTVIVSLYTRNSRVHIEFEYSKADGTLLETGTVVSGEGGSGLVIPQALRTMFVYHCQKARNEIKFVLNSPLPKRVGAWALEMTALSWR